MSEANKEIVRKAYGAMGTGDLDRLADLIDDDLVEHEDFPGLEPNKEGVLQFFKMMRAAFPDLTMTAHDVISEGDRVSIRATMSGTHRGEFMGIPATGRRMDVPLADFMRVSNGRIVEHWGVTDTETMMRQLGVLED